MNIILSQVYPEIQVRYDINCNKISATEIFVAYSIIFYFSSKGST